MLHMQEWLITCKKQKITLIVNPLLIKLIKITKCRNVLFKNTAFNALLTKKNWKIEFDCVERNASALWVHIYILYKCVYEHISEYSSLRKSFQLYGSKYS